MRRRFVAIGLSGVGVGVLLVALLTWRAGAAWRSQDAKGAAAALVGRELGADRPGYRPRLAVRLYGSDKASRDMCVYEFGPGGGVSNIWSVMYTRGLFRTVEHEQYTPDWRPAHSGGIVRDLCLHSAAEPTTASAL